MESCRHEGLTTARTDTGKVAALANGNETPTCPGRVSTAGDSSRNLIYCNCFGSGYLDVGFAYIWMPLGQNW